MTAFAFAMFENYTIGITEHNLITYAINVITRT